MPPVPRLILAAFALSAPLLAQDPTIPLADGYVTRVDATGFDVNGFHISVPPDAQMQLKPNTYFSVGNAREIRTFLGERATVFGPLDNKSHTITATRLVLDPQKPSETSGEGIIDWAQPPSGPEQLVRADGYQILITPRTKITYTAPLKSGAPINSDMLLAFHGKQGPDGVVTADKIVIASNIIKKGEANLRDKTDYDPKEVDPFVRQSRTSKFFKGVDPMQIAPYNDPAMQARLTSIGERLIPQYQRDLPAGDPTKIVFRFQLIDQKDVTTPISLPSGAILVPRHFIERMENDSQLASVLAEMIAEAIEKQTLHANQDFKTGLAGVAAGQFVGAFIPGVGLLSILGAGGTHIYLEHAWEDQRSRVGLWFMHDAGFDITEAPKAWWIFAGKPGKDLAHIGLPRRSAAEYQQLGTTWHHPEQPRLIPKP